MLPNEPMEYNKLDGMAQYSLSEAKRSGSKENMVTKQIWLVIWPYLAKACLLSFSDCTDILSPIINIQVAL